MRDEELRTCILVHALCLKYAAPGEQPCQHSVSSISYDTFSGVLGFSLGFTIAFGIANVSRFEFCVREP
eukprot:895379-Prorocentrum_minimum.AAC.3